MTKTVLIGREAEQARLRQLFDQTLAVGGQLAFVAGEAGSGKTTLVQSFVSQLQAARGDLIVAMGDCSSQGGLGDPYLPFREVLAVLTGVESGKAGARAPQEAGRARQILAHSVEVLVEVGPDLVGTILPGAALLATIGKTALEKTGLLEELTRLDKRKREQSTAVEQSHIFEQYANVLKTLAQQQPLLIVLDDLQWADQASVGLLFHLYRRLDNSPIFIIGTYRPDEIAVPKSGERNPLEKVLAEIKRYAGDVTLDLDQTSEADRRHLTNQLLDSLPNHFDPAFRQQLFQHTGGHPLFAVELLRTLRERGHLAQDAAGRWVARTVDWETLPARVEGVIEERIGRLDPEQREILNIASVEGTLFTAEVVAKISELPLRQLLKGLSQQLEKQHRLVQEKGLVKSQNARLAVFQFTHTLFQKYLYSELSLAERRLLHGDVARLLEEFYAQNTDEMSAQLAWHYDQADEADPAVSYYLQAGERANRQGAPHEARRFLHRALELLSPTETETRWRILLAREAVLKVLGEQEARRADVGTLLQLAQSFGEDRRLSQAHLAKAHLLSDTGDQRAVLPTIEQAIAAAARTGDADLQAESLGLKAQALIRLGEVAAGQAAIEQALAAMEQAKGDFTSARVLKFAWIYYYEAGDIARSLHYVRLALDVAQQTADRATEAIIRSNLGLNHAMLGMYEPARLALQESLRLSQALGYRRGRGYGLQNLALVTLFLGDTGEAERLAHQSLSELTDLSDVYGAAGSQMYLGFILDRARRLDEATEFYRQARAGFQQVSADGLAVEATAGLAHCALGLTRMNEATRHVAEVWAYLSQRKGVGIENLTRVYLTCAEVFAAAQDPTGAKAALAAGYHELMARAARISDPAWREIYLERVPEHQTMVRRWQEMEAAGNQQR